MNIWPEASPLKRLWFNVFGIAIFLLATIAALSPLLIWLTDLPRWAKAIITWALYSL